jgi:hypothetical protein
MNAGLAIEITTDPPAGRNGCLASRYERGGRYRSQSAPAGPITFDTAY